MNQINKQNKKNKTKKQGTRNDAAVFYLHSVLMNKSSVNVETIIKPTSNNAYDQLLFNFHVRNQ